MAMKLAAAFVMLAACASAPAVRSFEPMDRTAITRVLDDQVAAWNRGDLAAYMTGYANTPSLVFTSGGTARRGWQAAFDHYKARYATDRASMGSLAFEIIQIDPLGADGAVVLGTWTVTGGAHPGTGLFSVVLERRLEGWRVIHDHTSVAAP